MGQTNRNLRSFIVRNTTKIGWTNNQLSRIGRATGWWSTFTIFILTSHRAICSKYKTRGKISGVLCSMPLYRINKFFVIKQGPIQRCINISKIIFIWVSTSGRQSKDLGNPFRSCDGSMRLMDMISVDIVHHWKARSNDFGTSRDTQFGLNQKVLIRISYTPMASPTPCLKIFSSNFWGWLLVLRT